MLDSAAPNADPAAKPARAERPEQPNRTEQAGPAKAAGAASANAKPTRAAGAARGGEVAGASDAKGTKGENGDKAAGAKVEADTDTVSADAGDNALPQTTSPSVLLADTASSPGQPAAAALPTAAVDPALVADTSATATETVEADGAVPTTKGPRVPVGAAQKLDRGAAAQDEQGAIAVTDAAPAAEPAERAASKKSLSQAPVIAAKPTGSETQTQGVNATDDQGSRSEGIQPAPPQAGLPRAEASSDNKPQSSDNNATAQFHRTFAELTAGHNAADAPAPGQSDATNAATSANSGPTTGVPTQSSGPAASASTTAPQTPSPVVAVPLAGLAVEIATQAHAGKNHFEIRLDPPELGRINVKLDVDRDGNVTTRLVVDRSDTLDLLKRDASTLERALQQAGLKTSDHGLDFSLRQHSFAEQDASAQSGTRMVVPDNDSTPLEALRQGYGRLLGLGGGLDIRV